MNPILLLWVLFLLVVGVVLFLKMRTRYLKNKVVKKWDKVKGYITHINSNNEWYGINEKIPRAEKILLRYAYKYAGLNYTSSAIFIDSEATYISSCDMEEYVYKQNIPLFIQSIKAKPELLVWVNPNNPKHSVLVDISPRNFTYLLTGLVVVIWAICITIMCSDAFRINIAKKVTVLQQKEITEKKNKTN